VDGGHDGTPENEKGAQGATSRSQDGPFAGGVNVLQRNTAMQPGTPGVHKPQAAHKL
jgi:hypothetical protein